MASASTHSVDTLIGWLISSQDRMSIQGMQVSLLMEHTVAFALDISAPYGPSPTLEVLFRVNCWNYFRNFNPSKATLPHGLSYHSIAL